ncbi:MAG TPA: SDR family oxidoreductase [Aquabacterium sp.]|uniref:SDR family oxidoreductase n=1 Tax=Aquabacterium sp. TaxID=1872578 RepID=UPI002DA3D50B|nr:SDR family oxidoreductase [Aquabacterium sp.]HET6788323.1 SDR family oxidoreductase [Aquabacterium sp.]HEX5371637.1 SDR family oxidoreductase [Aquabacterium sp.]
MSLNVTVITGASDGIGAELARQLARQHGQAIALVLAARSQDKLAQVARECEALGASTLVRVTDVGVEADCRGLIADTITRFGRIDTLVNNAGMSAHALLGDVQDMGWYEDLMRINLWGSAWPTHAALPHLRASRGHIVTVSSLAGLVGVPGRTAYSATKFAQTGFFESLRVELAPHGVDVTLVYPGVVLTEIRHRGFNAQGLAAGKSSLDERGAMTVQECVRIMVAGMARRERDIVMTTKGKLGRWMKLLAPALVDKLALAALQKDS